jgi:hypothetical protein
MGVLARFPLLFIPSRQGRAEQLSDRLMRGLLLSLPAALLDGERISQIKRTVAAEIKRGLIEVLQSSGEMHEAKGVHAMVQIIQVAQLMEGHLGGPFHLKAHSFLRRGGGGLETVDGNEGGPTPLPRFSKHMDENGNEEIQVHNPYDLVTLRERQGFHGGDNRTGIVLMPSFVVCVQGMFHGGKNEDLEVKIAENVGGDRLDGQFTDLSQGNHTDGFITCVHRFRFFRGNGVRASLTGAF